MTGCSPAPTGGKAAARAARQQRPEGAIFRSDVAGLKIAAADRLPAHKGPLGDNPENCSSLITSPQTPEGKAVQAKGWAVLSEEEASGYRAVSFDGRADGDATGICILGEGNVALFKDGVLKAIVYAAKGAAHEISAAWSFEQRELRIFDTAWPSQPLADMRFGTSGSITIRPLAAQENVCGGKALVPNVYGMTLNHARDVLQRAGWSPQPDASKDPDAQFQGDASGVAFYAAHGLPEAEGCGVGMTIDQCAFGYDGKAGKLEITTNNMQPDRAPDEKWDWPKVLGYNVKCR